MPSSHLIDVLAAAERLGTTERHVRNLVYRQRIPYVKVGRLVRFDVAELERWLDERRVPARESVA
jgi:excisionase family DNA binding protein